MTAGGRRRRACGRRGLGVGRQRSGLHRRCRHGYYGTGTNRRTSDPSSAIENVAQGPSWSDSNTMRSPSCAKPGAKWSTVSWVKRFTSSPSESIEKMCQFPSTCRTWTIADPSGDGSRECGMRVAVGQCARGARLRGRGVEVLHEDSIVAVPTRVEGHGSAIGRERCVRVLGLAVDDAVDCAVVHAQGVDVDIPASIRVEGDPPPVSGDGRILVCAGVLRETLEFVTVRSHRP